MRRLLLALVTALAVVPAAGAWTWPANGRVLEPFTFDRSHPYEAGQHRGIAVAGDPASVVLAPAAGVVTFAGTVPDSGKTVTIRTGDGWSVTLTHLGSIAATKGATVAEGDGVGTIGPDGESEFGESYVHLGIRGVDDPNGYVDPMGLSPPRVESPPAAAPAAAASAGPSDPAPAAPAVPAVGDGAAAAPAVDAPAPAPAAQRSAGPATDPPAPTAVDAAGPSVDEPAARERAVDDATAPTVVAPAAVTATARAGAAAPTSAASTSAAHRRSGAGGATVVRRSRRPHARPATASTATLPAGAPPRSRASTGAGVGRPSRPHAARGTHRRAAPTPRSTPVETAPVARRNRGRVHADVAAASFDAGARPASPERVDVNAPHAAPTPAKHRPRARVKNAAPPWRSLVAAATASTAVVAALLAGVAAFAARRRRWKPAPIIVGDAVLHHDTDLLRELDPAHRARVHDDRGRHPGASPAAAWQGDLLPHRRRRARDEGVAELGGERGERAGIGPPAAPGPARGRGAAGNRARPLPHDGRRET